VTQPTFLPVSSAATVRSTMTTQTPELARAPKPGLQRSAHPPSGAGIGSAAPGGGYTLLIAQREIAKLAFAHEHDRLDVALGVALVAEKRASLIGRQPTLRDVQLALDLFALRTPSVIGHDEAAPFSGVAHSYVRQRALVDAVTAERLLVADATLDT
jgi:hypothetical protein